MSARKIRRRKNLDTDSKRIYWHPVFVEALQMELQASGCSGVSSLIPGYFLTFTDRPHSHKESERRGYRKEHRRHIPGVESAGIQKPGRLCFGSRFLQGLRLCLFACFA